MAKTRSVCGVCTFRHISKSSVVWCIACDEGLCTECQEYHSLSKTSRNHTTIPISEYQKLPPDVLNIGQYCKIHNEKYQIYCKKHESLCCSDCIVDSHNECRDFVKLIDVIKNAKTSNAFYEMEQTLVEVLENIKIIRENRQDNLRTLSKERAIIECEIEHTRITINKHLDKMKNDIIKELSEVEKQENKEICQLIKLLEERGNEIAECQRKISSIKKHASDLQAFLVMKQLEKDIFMKEEFVQSLVDKNSIKQYSLIFQPNTTLHNFVCNVGTFGKVFVQSKQHNAILTKRNEKQAQLTVQTAKSTAIEDISLKLHMTLNETGSYIYGCSMLPGNKSVFTNYYSSSIRILNKDGSLDCDLKTSHLAYDVECINKDTLVVTSNDYTNKCATIIDMKDKKVMKTRLLDSVAYGIAGTDDGLFYSGAETGIRMINLHDEPVRQIVRDKMPVDCYVATIAKNIYYTQPRINSVTCCEITGNKQWTFKNVAVLKYPVGISVDSSGNVFVAGYKSKNVVAISADGKRHREVLSSKDGLPSPWALYFDRSTNHLLVANFYSKAFIYDYV